MRKIVLLLFAGLTMLMSCSDDDSNDNNTVIDIVGTWQLSSLSVESTNDYNGDGVANANLLEETQCSQSDQLVFNTDGTGLMILDTENILLDAEQLPDNSYEYTFTCSSTGSNQIAITWTQDGNTITVVNFVNTMMFTLEENNTLTIVENDSLEVPAIIDNGGFFGVDYIFEDATSVYTKL